MDTKCSASAQLLDTKQWMLDTAKLASTISLGNMLGGLQATPIIQLHGMLCPRHDPAPHTPTSTHSYGSCQAPSVGQLAKIQESIAIGVMKAALLL